MSFHSADDASAPCRQPRPPVTAAPRRRRIPWLKLLAGASALYLIVLIALATFWCRQPPAFDVAAFSRQQTAALSGEPVPGTTFVATTIGVAETLLDKAGGFTLNDRLPPGVLLDNCPSWECGVVMALRDAADALRNDFGRARSQSAENLDLRRAALRFAVDPRFWLMPAPEGEYRKAIDALERYLGDLATGRVVAGAFSARADNLAEYLALVEKRLGNFGLRLGASIREPGLTKSLFDHAAAQEGHAGMEMEGAKADALPQPGHRTPPHRADNVFYCARGYSWAFLHFVQALRIDFASVLAAKGADPALRQIEHDLSGAIRPTRSPILLNGDGYGLLANHSLVLASYIARVNASVINVRQLLENR